MAVTPAVIPTLTSNATVEARCTAGSQLTSLRAGSHAASQVGRRKSKPRISKSTRAVLNYYLALHKLEFCMSLQAVAKAVFGLGEPSSKEIKRVQRANSRLRQLGILTWRSGHGPGNDGRPALPNVYFIEPYALRVYRRAGKRVEAALITNGFSSRCTEVSDAAVR